MSYHVGTDGVPYWVTTTTDTNTVGPWTLTVPADGGPTYWTFGTPKKEEKMAHLDNEVLDRLTNAREARHAAIRKMQTLRDEAALLRVAAQSKDSQADIMLAELNEQVPEPEDPRR